MENIAEHEKRKREAEDRALLIRLCDKYHYTHMMTRSSATGPVEIYYYSDTPIKELERIIGDQSWRWGKAYVCADDEERTSPRFAYVVECPCSWVVMTDYGMPHYLKNPRWKPLKLKKKREFYRAIEGTDMYKRYGDRFVPEWRLAHGFARTEVRRATAEDLKGYIDRWTLFGADADVVKTFCGMMSVDYSSYDSDFDAYDAAVAEYNSRK